MAVDDPSSHAQVLICPVLAPWCKSVGGNSDDDGRAYETDTGPRGAKVGGMIQGSFPNISRIPTADFFPFTGTRETSDCSRLTYSMLHCLAIHSHCSEVSCVMEDGEMGEVASLILAPL